MNKSNTIQDKFPVKPYHKIRTSFSKGEEISTHTSRGDAMVTVLEGLAKITVDNVDYQVGAGETIVMPATIPHALFAVENFKMILTVVFPKT